MHQTRINYCRRFNPQIVQTRWLHVTVVLLAGLLAVPAESASPDLDLILPRGGQRGTEMEIQLLGKRLQDAQELFLYEPGLEVLAVEPVDDKRVKVKIRIAADAPLGEKRIRLRTATGISTLRSFYVGLFPSAEEKEPNNDFDQPQVMPFPITIEGVANNEDVDFYQIEAKKGERIAVEVEGMRLGDTFFDPYIAILNSKRFVLTSSDDSALLLQDTAVAYVAPEDGKYVIEVRESSYKGNGNCRYRVHVGDFPRPAVIYPPGGKFGSELEIQYLGDVTGPIVQKFRVPDASRTEMQLFAQQGDKIAPSANVFRAVAFDHVLEVEPNQNFPEATNATAFSVPLAVNGILQEAGDIDCFRFKANKGQQLDVRVYGRAVRSPIDPVLNIYLARDNRHLAGNDDSGGPDSYQRFGVPEDGEYILRINDHLNQGGPTYVYRVEVTPINPALSVRIPEVARNSQDRQAIAVPQGNRFMTLMQANRMNIGGDLTLAANGLPAGVQMHCQTYPGADAVMPIVFEAAADAPIGGKLVDLQVKPTDEKQQVIGRLDQPINLVTGQNNAPFYTVIEDRLATAVVEPAPVKIEIVEPKVPLVHDGSMQVKVVAHRQGDFKGPIRVFMPFRSRGVGANSEVTIPENQTEALYPMNANGNAAVGDWPLVVLATFDYGKGPTWVSSQMAKLAVAESYVQVKINMTAAIQGQEAQVVCEITHNKPFEGEAKIELVGLPAKVSAPVMTFTKDQPQVVFPVVIDKESPVGQHKSLLCQVTITENGEPIFHNVGRGGVLRIDAPPPPKKEEPKKEEPKPQPQQPVAKAEPPKPAEKPLSRLEQLRLQAKERQDEQ